MRVGILTFHRAHNCGAMLQNYALQTVLRRLGAEPVTIDFNDVGEERRFSGLRGLTVKQRILRIIKFIFSIGFFDLRLYRFNRFRKKNLVTTNWISDGKLPLDFDRYVLGGDQVLWPGLTKHLTNTFLLDGIANSKRFSYAASFGYDSLPVEYRDVYKTQLSRFAAISIREKSGVGIIKNELGIDKEVISVLDPTLLLTEEDFMKIERRQKVPAKYVLVYSIGGADAKLREVSGAIARLIGASVVFVNACRRSYYDTPFGDLLTTSPDRLIYLIHNAAFVVTTSFHGVAFSIIYRRQFIAIGGTSGRKVMKIPDLLSALGIRERILNDTDSVEHYLEMSRRTIDYDNVYSILVALKSESLSFLNKIVGGSSVKEW